MPTYTIRDIETGESLRVTGATPPSPQDAEELFQSYYESKRTTGGQLFESAKGVGRGFANAFLTAGEGLAELADAATDFVGAEDLIDSGEDNALVMAAREGRAAVDEAMGADSAYRDTWATKFGEGLGSFASFFTPAGAIKLLGMAGKGATALKATGMGSLAAGTGAGEAAQRIEAARDRGIEVTDDQENLAVLGGTVVGFSELITPSRLLKRISGKGDKLPSGIKERLSSALRSGTEEGLQEVSASIAQDAIQKNVYDPNFEIAGGNLFEEFTIGGAIGAGADLVLNAAAGRRNNAASASAFESEKKIREQQDQAIKDREKILSQDLEIQKTLDAEQRLQAEANRESNRVLAEQSKQIDPSQIDQPVGRKITPSIRTGSRYVSMVDTKDGTTFQAEERVRVRNKGKPNETTTTFVNVPDKGEVITSVNGQAVPAAQSGFQVITAVEPSESILSSSPQDRMLAYAQHISRTMGDSFPSGNNMFTVKLPQDYGGKQVDATTLKDGAPVFLVEDSKGNRYGKPLQTSEEAFALAGHLNTQIINNNVYAAGDAAIKTSGQSYNESQINSLQRYNFAANHPDSNTYSAPAVDGAAETTQDRGFDELANIKDLMAEGVSPRNMTASQRINAKRMRKGLPPTKTFTIQEVKSVLNDQQLYNLTDTRLNGLPETETYKAGLSKNGNPVVYSSAGETLQGRPLTTLEKDAAIKKNPKKKPPKIVRFKTQADAIAYSNQLNNTTNRSAVNKGVMRNVNADLKGLQQLLKSKNITSEVGSPEIRYLAKQITGSPKPLSSQTEANQRLFYQKIRSLPRFDRPTKLPIFKEKKYTGAQFRAALSRYQKTNNLDNAVSAAGIAPQTAAAKDLKRDISSQTIDPVVTETVTEEVAVDTAAPLALPAPRKLENLRKSIKERMTKYGLKDVAVNLDNALNTAARGADGQLYYGIRPARKGDAESILVGGSQGSGRFAFATDIDPEGRAQAYYSRSLNQIFLGVNEILGKKSLSDAEIEAEVLSVLDHEMIHAMRQLDLFTTKEWSLLSNAAINKEKENNQTYIDWAIKNYEGLTNDQQIEEAIAELVRDAVANPKVLQGKPRSLVTRIVEFFRNLVSSLRKEGFTSAEDIVSAITSGEIGARERIQRTERETRRRIFRDVKAAEERGQTKVALGPDAETLAEEVGAGQQIPDFVESDIAQDAEEVYTADVVNFSRKAKPTEEPKNVVKAYKLFTYKNGQVYPLFVEGATPIPIGEWIKATDPRTEGAKGFFIATNGKPYVKATTGGNKELAPGEAQRLFDLGVIKNPNKKTLQAVAFRPGFHSGDLPIAPHIGGKTSKKLAKPDFRKNDQIWAEVEVPADVDWQSVANANATTKVDGTIDVSTADITDQMPIGGYYRYKTQPNMFENWMISGSIKITKVLTDKEAREIAAKAGVSDLPRRDDYVDPIDVGGLMLSKRPLEEMGKAESMGMTNTDIMPTEEDVEAMKNNTYKPERKRTLVEAATFLQEKWERATGRTTPFEYTEENISIISDMLATEALSALDRDGNAIGWYDRKIKSAKDIMRLVDPRIMKSKENEALFDFLLAVTSNGQAVVDNFKIANDLFSSYMKNKKLPETKAQFDLGGERNEAMLQAFKFYNAYENLRKTSNQFDQPIYEFLDQDVKVRDLREVAEEFNRLAGYEAMVIPSAEGANVDVKVSYILGPKIGQGFYQNIRGNYDPLTMDIWWMRMWNRAVGRPFETAKELQPRRDELANLFKKVGGLPKKLIKEVEAGYPQTIQEITEDPDLMDSFIRDVEKRYQKFYKEYKEKNGVNHQKPDVFKKTGTFVKNLKPQLQATPKGVEERAYMREVVKATQQRLKERNYDISTADFQALMWYPEKQLFRALGVQPGRGSDNDYLDAAVILAESKGVPSGKIEKALRESERRRGASDPSPRGADGELREAPPRKTTKQTGEAFTLPATKLKPKKIPEGVAEKVAEENLEKAETAPVGDVPLVNPKSSAYSQAVAKDPSKGQKLDPGDDVLFSRGNGPDINPVQQAAINRVSQEIPTDTPGQTYLNVLNQGSFNKKFTQLKQKAVNRYAQVENYEKKGALGPRLADSSALAALLFADRSNAITAAALQYGVPVYKNGLVKVVDFEHRNDRGEVKQYNGLIDLMSMLYTKEHGSLEQIAQSYAIAKRAERLKARGLQVPGSDADHAQNIKTAESFLDADGNSIIKDWYNAWQAYNSYTIKFLKDTGMLNEQTAEAWRLQSDYIPFYRQLEGSAFPNVPNVFGGLTSSSELKAIRGSEKALNVPMLEAITLNLNAAITMGMKNVAQQRLVRDMNSIGLAREVGKGEKTAGQNVVSFKVRGKKRNFYVDDPLVYESLTIEPASGVERTLTNIFGAPARFLREMVTREPGFVIANMLRDSLSAFTTSGSNFIPIVDTLRGFLSGMEKLEKTGVVGGYDYKNDPQNIGEFAGKILGQRNKNIGSNNYFVDGVKKLWDITGHASTLSDAATRNAVYEDVLARTGNEAEATFQAMEVLNFGRRGSNPVMRVIAATVPFLNARIQGLDVLARAAAGTNSANRDLSRGKVAASFLARGGILAALTMYYYTMVSDDEQYEEQTEEIKDNYWIIPRESGIPAKIPIPFEVGLIFKTIPERIMDAYNKGTTAREAQQSAMRAITGTLAVQPPQAITPLLEAYTNYDLYRGRPVTPVYIDSRGEEGLQQLASTTEIAKAIGAKTGMSPIKIDHLIQGYTGTIGGYVLSEADRLLRSTTIQGDNRNVLPARDATQYPIARRFFGSEFGGGVKEDFYEMYDYVRRLDESVKSLYEAGRGDEVDAFILGREELVGGSKALRKVSDRLAKIRRMRRKVLESDMSAEEKQEYIRELNINERYVLEVVPELQKMFKIPTYTEDISRRLFGG